MDNNIVLQEDYGFLQIPGVGWQTFCCTADQDNSLNDLNFKSGTAYYRFYWSKLEPIEGQFAFEMVDEILARCRENNQALAFRIMCEDPTEKEGLPDWLVEKGIDLNYSQCPQVGAHYVPDMTDPVFKYYHERLIRSFGERYDGHPDLALVDIGSVGLWGEWHIFCDPELMPDPITLKEITDLYFEAFPNTPLSAQVSDTTCVDYAVHKGNCGWRGDSWGNLDPNHTVSTHHSNLYWPTNNRIPDAWKTGTIALEPGVPTNTMNGWTAPIKEIVDDAVAWHVTFVNNKSQSVPREYIAEIERLVKKMGFRLVLRKMDYSHVALRGSELTFRMEWENIGIAPPYRDYRIALRLRNDKDEIRAVVMTDLSIKGWLPGQIHNTIEYHLPDDLETDRYYLELGLVFHSSIKHNIPIANTGKTPDGWYKVGEISIVY